MAGNGNNAYSPKVEEANVGSRRRKSGGPLAAVIRRNREGIKSIEAPRISLIFSRKQKGGPEPRLEKEQTSSRCEAPSGDGEMGVLRAEGGGGMHPTEPIDQKPPDGRLADRRTMARQRAKKNEGTR